MTTLVASYGVVVEAACSSQGELEARIRATENDGLLGIGVTFGTGQSDSQLERDLDAGQFVSLELGHDDVATADFNYAGGGPTVGGQVSTVDGGGVAAGNACGVWGVYETAY